MKNKEGEKATGQKPLTMGPAVAPRSARGACSLDTLKIFFDPFFSPAIPPRPVVLGTLYSW